jgi:hypothetical protein
MVAVIDVGSDGCRSARRCCVARGNREQRFAKVLLGDGDVPNGFVVLKVVGFVVGFSSEPTEE